MSFNNNGFNRLSYFDPETKFSEFRNKYLKDHNKMFADSNRWPNGMSAHSKSMSDNNRFDTKEEGIPIKVIHETSDDRPNSETNDEKNYDSMSSFDSSQSQRSNDTSNSGGSVFSNRSQEPSSGEPRVYHIPITVEPRNGSTSSGYTSESNANTEQPLSRSSSHSSAHSIGSSGQTINTSEQQSNDKKERVSQIPIEIKTNQRSASPLKEAKPVLKKYGSTPKPKPKSGPFVTRIPVVNQNESQPQINESTLDSNTSTEQKIDSNVDPMEKINDILKDLNKYEEEVKQFKGTSVDKKYRYLDEMLTRFMIKLDTIETSGKEDVRKARKAAVLAVNNCIALLEQQVIDNKTNVDKSDAQNQQKYKETSEPMQISTPEPNPLPKTDKESINSNQMESQNTDIVEQNDNKIQSNDKMNNSEQNSSQNQNLEKKTIESHRKETAV